MTCAAGADVGDAWLAIDSGGDAFENWLHDIPCGGRAAGHDGRAFAGTFFTTGNTSANKTKAEIAQPFVAALSIGVEGVSSVDDDVTLIE